MPTLTKTLPLPQVQVTSKYTSPPSRSYLLSEGHTFFHREILPLTRTYLLPEGCAPFQKTPPPTMTHPLSCGHDSSHKDRPSAMTPPISTTYHKDTPHPKRTCLFPRGYTSCNDPPSLKGTHHLSVLHPPLTGTHSCNDTFPPTKTRPLSQ